MSASSTPQQVGPWRLIAPAGAGGMAVVWKVEHRATGQIGALKATRPRRVSAAYVALFQQEIRAVAALDHPGVVRVYDHGVVRPGEAIGAPDDARLEPGSPWLVMEWLDGGTLSQRLGQLPWTAQRDLLLRLLDALAHAHAREVIHRDLKPSNVLLDAHGQPKLADFGLAVPLERIGAAPETERTHGPRRSSVIGTPTYMAPEQVQGAWRRMGPWTDLYALGGLAWALATGAPPFAQAADTEIMLQAQCSWPLPPFAPTQAVPEALLGWLARLLEKAPGARFVFAADAAWALGQLEIPRAIARSPSSARPLHLPTFTFFDDPSASLEGTLDETLDETVDLPARTPQPMPTERPPLPPSWVTRTSPPPQGGRLSLMALRRPRLVGREPEQALLWRGLSSVVQEGRPRAVLLRGPSGLGKSSLARWISERAHELGLATPLEAWHHPEPQGGHGLAGLVARATRSFGLSLPAARARVGRWLEGLGAQDPVLTEGLSRLVADPEHRPQARELQEDLLRFIELLAERRPALLWLDDVQWGEPAIELCAAALRRLKNPVFIVLTANDESLEQRATAARQLSALAEQDRVEVRPLSPLSPEATLAQVQQLSGLPEASARRLAERVTGDPLTVTELLRVGSAEGWLREAPEGVTLAPDAPLPERGEDLWRRGLDAALLGLPDEAERALALAALLGEWVSPEVWAAACEALGVAPVQDALLSQLLDAGLAQRAPRQEGWSWRHARVRASALRRSPEELRPPLHAACVTALRARPGPEALAQRGAHEVAAGQHTEGLQTLLQAFDALFEAERASEMRPVIDRARAALGSDTPPRLAAELTLREARYALSEARWEDALALAAKLEASAAEAGWRALEVKALMVTAGVRSATRVDAEVGQLARRILARSEGVDDPHVRAYASYTAGRLLSYLGHTQDARRALEEAERLSEATGLLRQGTYARCQLGYRDLVDGHLARARARLIAGRDLSDQHGYRLMTVWSRCLLAVAELLDGRSAEAIRLLEEAIERCTLTLTALRLAAWLDLGWALIEHGDRARAREVLTACREQSSALGAKSYANLAALELAVCDAEEGDWDHAQEALPDILATLEEAAVVEINEPILLRRLARLAEGEMAERLAALAALREGRLRG